MYTIIHTHSLTHSHEPLTQTHTHPPSLSLTVNSNPGGERLCCSSFWLLSPEITHEKEVDQRKGWGVGRVARPPELSDCCHSWLHTFYTCVQMYYTWVPTCVDTCPHWLSMHRVESLQVTLRLAGFWNGGAGKGRVSSVDTNTLLSGSLPLPCPEWTL